MIRSSCSSVWTVPAILAGSAAACLAHVVPIPPSACRLDHVMVRSAMSGVETAAEGGDTVDGLRLVYDANASVVRLCTTAADDRATCAAVAPRTFAMGDTAVSLALPLKASGTMTTSGDVEFRDLPVEVTAGTTVTVPVTLTTGLVALGDTVLEGTPLQGFGGFTLRGILDGAALPPAFGGVSLLLTATCTPRPIPDVDQFVPASRVARLVGRIDGTALRVGGVVHLGPADSVRFGRAPLLVSLRFDDQPVQTAVFSNFTRGRRRSTATSDDQRVTLTLARRGASAMVIALAVQNPSLPAAVSGKAVIVGITIDSSRLLARGERLFKPSPDGGLHRR